MKKLVAQIEFDVEPVAGLTDKDANAIAYVEEILPEVIKAVSQFLATDPEGPKVSVRIADNAVSVILDTEV